MSVHQNRVASVLVDVKAGRLASREAVERYVEKTFTIPTAERSALVRDVLAGSGFTEKQEDRVMPEPNVLRGKALAEAAAAIFRRRPSASAREVYRELAKQHKIGMSESSWVNGGSTAARKLARGDQPAAPTAKKASPARKARPVEAAKPAAAAQSSPARSGRFAETLQELRQERDLIDAAIAALEAVA